jgi:serine protease
VKKLFIAILSVSIFLLLFVDEASATEQKTIAIIDTGIDATHPVLQGKIVHEVCLLDFPVCPNGQRSMEGVGSSTIDPKFVAGNTFYHGTQMASIVIANNPDAKIVFIRIVPMTPRGGKASVSTNALGNALKWVVDNKDKHNISVVSVSMGMPNRTASCASNSLVESSIVSLKDSGVPAIFANGNNRTYDRVDFPACFTPAIAVGGSDVFSNKYFPALYSNNSSATDFFVHGKMRVAMPNGRDGIAVGSSNSTALLASKWLMLSQRGLSYQEIYDTINASSTTVSTKNVLNARVLDHNLLR